METSQNTVTARRFIRTGMLAGASESDVTTACDMLIQAQSRTSVRIALRTAKRFVDVARPFGNPMQLTAWRSYARLLHMSGQHKDAAVAYENARQLSAGDPLTRGRIDRALIDVYMYLSAFDKARLRARSALRAFTALSSESDLAQTRVNLANVLHRQDRHREAERLYRDSAAYFDAVGNRIASARCYYNRANTLVQLFDLDEAERLYTSARDIYEADGLDLDACDARYGLAWLHMLRGKLHIALLELTACEKRYRQAGDPRGEALCSLDRAEVYLNLGLYTDALAAARLSERMFLKLGLVYEAAKSALFRGQAAISLGHTKEAKAAWQRAHAGFAQERNIGFLGATHLLGADLADNARVWKRHVHAARFRFERADLPLWQAICDLKQTLSDGRAIGSLERLRGNPAVKAVPYLYALWQTAEGDLALRQHDLARARRSWQCAADRIDLMRAQLPPVELRSSSAVAIASPHQRLVRSLLREDPESAAYWSERSKTAGLWAPLAGVDLSQRQQVEDGLSALARQFASLSHRIAVGSERQLSAPARSQYVRRLQRTIREHLATIEGGTNQAIDSQDRLREEIKTLSHTLPIVQFHSLDDDLLAFVHHCGTSRACLLRHGMRRLASCMERWRFVAESELLSKGESSATWSIEQSLFQELTDWLWAPLEISRSVTDLLFIPEGELFGVPWLALPGHGGVLGDTHRFVVAPSIRHFLHARRIHAGSDSVYIFRGSDDNLSGVAGEIDFLQQRCNGRSIVFSPARRAEWPGDGAARIWHYAGHATLREENPFYSYLLLADGPLFATDFRLKNCQVELVTLAACRSGDYQAHRGGEPVGLVRSLLEMGARNVVAGNWAIADRSAAMWMKLFYDRYLDGTSISESVRSASLAMRDRYRSAFHWAAFAVHGAGS